MTRKTGRFAEEVNAYNISVTGRHLQVTEPMKAYAFEKVSKMEKLEERIIDIDVVMDIQRVDHRVDIRMKVDNTKIVSSAVTDNMYASIDLAVRKLERQVKKYKERLHAHHARNVNAVDMVVNVIRGPDSYLADVNAEIDEENQRHMEEALRPHEVVKKERRPCKTLLISEAVMKMDLSQDPFLIYRDEADQRLKVIYRRNDGNYGIIEPQV